MMYYLLASPSDISTVAQNGQLICHLKNYLRIYPIADGLPPNLDGGKFVYKIDVPDHLINKVAEGPVTQTLLWQGNKDGRDEKSSLVTVTIHPLNSPPDPVLTEKNTKLMQQVLDLEKALEEAKAGLSKANAEVDVLRAELVTAKAERNKLSVQRTNVSTNAGTNAGAHRVPTKE